MPTHVAGEGSKSFAKPKEGKGKLHHIEVHHGENGGHLVVHHMERNGMLGMNEPKHHVFGPGQGDKALAHIAKVMGIPGAAEEEGEAEHKGGKESVNVEED